MKSYRQKNLEAFSSLGIQKDFPSKTILEVSGRPKSYVYLLLHGHVRQYFIAPEGTEKTLLLLSRGDLFGEITCLQQDHDQVFTQALSSVSVCQIPVKDFIALLFLMRSTKCCLINFGFLWRNYRILPSVMPGNV